MEISKFPFIMTLTKKLDSTAYRKRKYHLVLFCDRHTERSVIQLIWSFCVCTHQRCKDCFVCLLTIIIIIEQRNSFVLGNKNRIKHFLLPLAVQFTDVPQGPGSQAEFISGKDGQ